MKSALTKWKSKSEKDAFMNLVYNSSGPPWKYYGGEVKKSSQNLTRKKKKLSFVTEVT